MRTVDESIIFYRYILICLLKMIDEDLQIYRYGAKENKDMIKEND